MTILYERLDIFESKLDGVFTWLVRVDEIVVNVIATMIKTV